MSFSLSLGELCLGHNCRKVGLLLHRNVGDLRVGQEDRASLLVHAVDDLDRTPSCGKLDHRVLHDHHGLCVADVPTVDGDLGHCTDRVHHWVQCVLDLLLVRGHCALQGWLGKAVK